MLEGIALVALASTAATAPTNRRHEESFVIVRKERSASVEQAIERVLSGLLAETVTTYQSDPLPVGSKDIPFVSPVISSFTIKAKLKVGGEIVQPPIDFDEIVYFDE